MDGWPKLLILLTLVLFQTQDAQTQQACRFNNPGSPEYIPLTVDEDAALGELIKYTSTDVASMIDPPDEEYIDFIFENGELTLQLVKSLTELLDAGVKILQPEFSVTCEDGSSFDITVYITITDVNNKPAVFDQPVYPVSLTKSWPSNVPINFGVPIKVTDEDLDLANADVVFSTDNGNVNIVGVLEASVSPFVYNVILTLKDPYQFPGNTEIIITATNGDEMTPETARVEVTVEDINVYPPEFDQPLYVTATKVTWPPESGGEVPLSMAITAPDPEGSTVQFSIGGDHPNLVNIVQTGDSVTLVFNYIPDPSDFDSTNGIAVIQVIAKDVDNLESTAVVLIVFDIVAPPTTTDAGCPETTTDSCVCPTTEPGTTPAECPDVTTPEPCIPCSTPPEGTTPAECPDVTTPEPCIPCSTPSEGTTPGECPEATTVTVTVMEPCPTTPEGTTVTECPDATTAEPCVPCSTPSEGTTTAECPEVTTVTVSEPCIPCSTAAEGISTSTALPCEQCDECTCPPVTCPGDPGVPCECDSTTSEKPDDGDDDECEDASNIGFIIGIVITSVLFVASAVLAAYLWFLLRKARIFTNLTPAEPWNPPMQQQSKLSAGSLTPKPVAVVVETNNANPVRRPSILKRTSFQDASSNLDSPTNDFEKERELRNSLTQAKNPHVESLPSPAASAAPAPTIPSPDYRTKPDYKVKINDTVEIVPNEVTEYSNSDNERNPNSGANSDMEANEGDERL